MTTSHDINDRAWNRQARRRHRRTIFVAATVAAALAINLVIYALGRVAGGTFRFTASAQVAEVDALTVAGFTVLPLLLGMTAAAVLSRRWRWVVPVALAIGPLLALGTILVMTVPADLDTTSKLTLALCHVALVPITIVGLLRIRGLNHQPSDAGAFSVREGSQAPRSPQGNH
jgi:hypothetical protein